MERDEASKLLTAPVRFLVFATAFQVLSPKFDIAGNGEVKAASKLFKDERPALLANRKASACEVPPAQDTTDVLPGRTLFMSTMPEEYSLYKMYCHLHLNM